MALFGSAIDNLPKACQDIGVTENRFREDVIIVKQWLQLQPHLPKIGDGLFVENMLLRSKGSIELTKKTIDSFFSMRHDFPDIFTNMNPCSKEAQISHELRKIAFLNGVTSDGYRVIVANMPDPKHLDRFHLATTLKLWLMSLDLLTDKDISAGVIYIADASNISMGHTTMLLKDLPLFQKTVFCAFSGYKCRVKGIHLLNPPPAVESILRLVKKVLPQKISERIHMHPDLASLHKHVEKEILPQEYGGNQKPFLELAEDWRIIEKAHYQWFMEHEKLWTTDESKRPETSANTKASDSFGIDGTFKKLEFD